MKYASPCDRLVEHVIVYDAWLLGILKLGMQLLVVLVEYAAFLRGEHKIVLIVILISSITDVLIKGEIRRRIPHRNLSVVVQSVRLCFKVVFIQHAFNAILSDLLWRLQVILHERLILSWLLNSNSNSLLNFLFFSMDFLFPGNFPFFILVVKLSNQMEDSLHFFSHLIVLKRKPWFYGFNICKLKNQTWNILVILIDYLWGSRANRLWLLRHKCGALSSTVQKV